MYSHFVDASRWLLAAAGCFLASVASAEEPEPVRIVYLGQGAGQRLLLNYAGKDLPLFAGQLHMQSGKTAFLTFCVDPLHPIGQGQTYRVSPWETGDGLRQGPRIAYLYNEYGQAALRDNTLAAALQVAIWDEVVDGGDGLSGGTFRYLADDAVARKAGEFLAEAKEQSAVAQWLDARASGPDSDKHRGQSVLAPLALGAGGAPGLGSGSGNLPPTGGPPAGNGSPDLSPSSSGGLGSGLGSASGSGLGSGSGLAGQAAPFSVPGLLPPPSGLAPGSGGFGLPAGFPQPGFSSGPPSFSSGIGSPDLPDDFGKELLLPAGSDFFPLHVPEMPGGGVGGLFPAPVPEMPSIGFLPPAFPGNGSGGTSNPPPLNEETPSLVIPSGSEGAVPEPATLVLVGLGLACLAIYSCLTRRRRSVVV